MSRPRLVGLLLVLATLLVYLPVAHYGFVTFDDKDYVSDNSIVQKGLTWAGIEWAFATDYASNWHPVTWLSHMADCGLFGLNPGAHHFVNVLFHAANVVLLFALLLRLANSLWPAAFIAALFAWHPLHVESVAWISERKDVLSTFFALLSLLSYTRYAQKRSRVESRESNAKTSVPALDPRPSTLDYSLALVFFALGLMSKPMLVTLPFVMLLLDYWPLQRFNAATIQRLFVEKIPFFLLTAVSCIVTFFAQRNGHAIDSLDMVPLHFRLYNMVASYGLYLLKMVWPSDLAVIYPLSKDWSRMQVTAAVSGAALLVISWLAWRGRRTRPYLLVGWLWFLGTLVPVIGLVQVGGAALADRYTYFPLIGIFIAVTFGIRDLSDRFQIPKIAPASLAALILAACVILTENQLRYWHDGVTLFVHALAVTKDNDIARTNLGVALEQDGRLDEALEQYRAAEKLNPQSYIIHNNLGNLLDNLGDPGQSLDEYRTAIRLNPTAPFLHDSLGIVLVEFGRFAEAMDEFSNSAQLDPTYPWPHFQMAKALLKQGRDAGAVEQFRAALNLDPDNFQILTYTAHVLAAEENPEVRDGKAALALATKANSLTGGEQPLVLDALGMAFAETGDFTNAQDAAQDAVNLATALKMKNIGPMRQRLELYKNRRPWRESFLSTNAPPEILPKN